MEALRPKPVSTAFYLTSYLGGGILGGIVVFLGAIGIAGGVAANEEGHEAAMVFTGIGGLLLIVGIAICLYAFIVLFVLYYKMWDAIQDGHARTSPGAAVGLMFIPLFNIYWMFQALWGFSKDYNAYLKRHQIAGQPLPENLFLIYCILTCVSAIPYIGALCGIAGFIIFIILLIKICAAINTLANAPQTSILSATTEQPRENWRGM